MGGVALPAMPRGHVQAHERFSSPRHARHKHDRLPAPDFCCGDDLLDRVARGGEIHSPGVATGDVVNRMPGVERPGRLDDRGRRRIGSRAPGGWVDEGAGKGGRRLCLVKRQGDRLAERLRIAAKRRSHAVGMGQLPTRVAPRRLRGTEDRKDRRQVARSMKILEIEAIVPGLLVVEPFKLFRANLKLNRHDCFAGDKHGIDPPTEPRDIELKMDPRALMRGVGKSCTEHRQLQPPRGKLLGDEREAMGAGQRRVDRFVARGEKIAHWRGVGGGIEARAQHAGQPTTPGGQSWPGGCLTEKCSCVHFFACCLKDQPHAP